MNLESIIIALIAALPGLVALIGTIRKDRAQAGSIDAETEKLRDEITRSVLATAQQEINKYTGRITDLESLVERQNQRIANLLEQNATLTHELQMRDRVITELRNEIERFGRRVTELQERLAKYEAAA